MRKHILYLLGAAATVLTLCITLSVKCVSYAALAQNTDSVYANCWSDLDNLIKMGYKDITITNNISATSEVSIDNNTHIDLSGHTITANNTNTDIFNISSSGTLHIFNGCIDGGGKSTKHTDSLINIHSGTLTLENIDFTNTYSSKGIIASSFGTILCSDGAIKIYNNTSTSANNSLLSIDNHSSLIIMPASSLSIFDNVLSMGTFSSALCIGGDSSFQNKGSLKIVSNSGGNSQFCNLPDATSYLGENVTICNSDSNGIINSKGATLYLSGGTISSNSANGIYNYGTLYHSSGIISHNINAGVYQAGEYIMSNDAYVSSDNYVYLAPAHYLTIADNLGGLSKRATLTTQTIKRGADDSYLGDRTVGRVMIKARCHNLNESAKCISSIIDNKTITIDSADYTDVIDANSSKKILSKNLDIVLSNKAASYTQEIALRAGIDTNNNHIYDKEDYADTPTCEAENAPEDTIILSAKYTATYNDNLTDKPHKFTITTPILSEQYFWREPYIASTDQVPSISFSCKKNSKYITFSMDDAFTFLGWSVFPDASSLKGKYIYDSASVMSFSDHVNLYGIWGQDYMISYTGNYPADSNNNPNKTHLGIINGIVEPHLLRVTTGYFNIFDNYINETPYFTKSIDYSAQDEFYYDTNLEKYTDYHLDYSSVGFSFSSDAHYDDDILHFSERISSLDFLIKAADYAVSAHDLSFITHEKDNIVITLSVVWDEYPIIKEAYDISVMDTQAINLCEKDILENISVFDSEDGILHNMTDVNVLYLDNNELLKLENTGAVSVTITASDGAKNQISKEIMIWVNSSSHDEVNDGYVRFINEDAYNMHLIPRYSDENYKKYGGLHPNSLWYKSDTYCSLIRKAFSNLKNNTPLISYSYNSTEKEKIRNSLLDVR